MSEIHFVYWFLIIGAVGRFAIMLWFEWEAWLRRRDMRRREGVMPGPGSVLYPWNRKPAQPDRSDKRSYRKRLKDF